MDSVQGELWDYTNILSGEDSVFCTWHKRSVAIKKDGQVQKRHLESNSTEVLWQLHTMKRHSRAVEL